MGALRTGLDRGVSLVVVSLDVSVTKGFLHASDDWLDGERWFMGQRVGENVSCSNFNRLLEKIVFQNNKARVASRYIAENVFPVL